MLQVYVPKSSIDDIIATNVVYYLYQSLYLNHQCNENEMNRHYAGTKKLKRAKILYTQDLGSTSNIPKDQDEHQLQTQG